MGWPSTSSARMVPMPHTSTLGPHGSPSITSGARYQRDCTYELWQSQRITAEPKSISLNCRFEAETMHTLG